MAIKISGNTVIDNDNNLVNLESATFTGTSYLKLPSGDASTRPESPLNGTIRYNNASGFLETRSNDNWDILGSFDIRLSGGSQLYANVPNFFLISNYDSRRVYNVSTTNGTISITDDLILYVPENTGPGGFTVNNRTYSGTVIAGNPPGQAEFTTVGEHEFTVPYGVTKISAVVIGGGGGGADDTTNGACGGNGGNLVYANDIPVTPNEVLSVFVGKGGLGSTNGTSGQKGGDSYISRPNEIILGAFGGIGGDVGIIATNQTNDFLYEGINFYVGSQDGTPLDIFFKSDGTKMYMVGSSTDTVYQYTLTEPWVVSTASYDSVSFYVGNQDSFPTGIFFGDDGSKMYMIGGGSTDRVYQYALSTPWVVSTASYDSINFSVGSQDSSPYDIFFKPDGTKMYIIGASSDTVYQYTLSTAWDLSTASYDSVIFSVGSQDSFPVGMSFKSDGTKMYMVGVSTERVYQYTLTEPWVVSTASYDSVSFSFESQDGGSFGIFFKDDGSKMHMVGTSTDKVYQYSLVQSASANTVFGLGGTGGAGTSAYDNAGGGGGAAGYGGNGGNGGTYNGTSAAGSDATPNSGGGGGGASTTGTTDVGGGGGGANIYGPVFGDKSQNDYSEISLDIANTVSYPSDVFFRPDGKKYYAIDSIGDTVYQFSLDTAWDLSTASYDNNFKSLKGETDGAWALFFKPDGSKMYVTDTINERVYQYTLTTPWVVSTASYDNVFKSVFANPTSIFIKEDENGCKMYVLSELYEKVYQYTLTTPWDLSTLSYDNVSFDVNGRDNELYGLFFKSDGTKMYISGNQYESVYQYTLTTPWVVSTASYDNIKYKFVPPLNTSEVRVRGIFFKPDGSRMYASDSINYIICEYALTTNWEVSTLTNYSPSHVYLPEPISTIRNDLTFKSDGTKMYILLDASDTANGTVHQYTLNDPWDVTSSTYDSVSYELQDSNNFSMISSAFSANGDILFTLSNNRLVQIHNLLNPWDLSTASYSGITFDLSSVRNNLGQVPFTTITDFFFKPDGKKLYLIDNSEKIAYFDLTSDWDITSSTYDSNIFYGSEGLYYDRINFTSDGSKMFTSADDNVQGVINEYILTTPWDLNTAIYINNYEFNEIAERYGFTPFEFKPDLSRMYIIPKTVYDNNEPILQIDLFEPGVFYYELGGKGPFAYGLSGSTGAQSGFNGLADPTRGDGGLYGGGGAAASLQTGRTAGNGAQGAVRIIWGDGRSYPSTNVGDV